MSSDPARRSSGLAHSGEPAAPPYGTWRSPITADCVAAGALRLGAVVLDGDDIYWTEARPDEAGRVALVRCDAGRQIADVLPTTANVRTRVNEYGGAAYAVHREVIYFTEFQDQRIYRAAPGGTPAPLTPPGAYRYADYAIDVPRGRLVCVREDHTEPDREPVTTLVSVPLAGPTTAGDAIVSGHDFFAAPRLSPDGSQLAWLAWHHPNMPWDGTELWVGDVTPGGGVGRARVVAGGETDAIFQPGWSPDGALYFVSDRTGWWNLYRTRGDGVELVVEMAMEVGRPSWQLGMSTWAFADASRMVVSYQQVGRWRLGLVDVRAGAFRPLGTDLEPGEQIAATRTHVVCVGGSPAAPDALIRLDLTNGATETIRAASSMTFDPGYLSVPAPIEFSTDDGLTAHAFYYAPANRDVATTSRDERPPLIVISHGGPTASTNTRLNLEIQYWTSRGFSVVDVNYGGSSGYGRVYRRRLNGRWGVVDVADCVNAARHLVAAGRADPDRLIIRGRSAGGYTTLAALTFRSGAFHAGASYYGVSDLDAMARETHKFESRYLDGLIGPYPERRDVYHARSPIHAIDQLVCPIIFFQGLEDRVVPPNQSMMMAAAVRAKGLPVALLTFAGEQHGFRARDTIARCLEAELSFYGAVFGFTPAGTSPLAIDNLEHWRASRARP